MSQDALLADEIFEMAKKDRAAAHDEARRRVAADPSDERSAMQLRDVLREFPPVSLAPTPDPLEGAAPEVRHAAKLLESGKLEDAEVELRKYIAHTPLNPQAMRLMASIARECGLLDRAYKILTRSLEVDRKRAGNWAELGKVLHQIATDSGREQVIDEAIAALDQATRLVPHHLDALSYKAAVLVHTRRLDEALAVLEELSRAHPQAAIPWVNHGYILKTLGRFGEAVAAYRTSVAIDPTISEGWFGLADLKVSRMFPSDISEMEEQLASLSPKGRSTIHAALAKAYDTQRDYQRAAEHLLEGNSLRFEQHPHESEKPRAQVDSAMATYTRPFFEKHRRDGDPSKAPIFIIGMPRSGSTLIEQILSSHSLVEGTEELYGIQEIQREILRRAEAEPGALVAPLVARLDRASILEFGQGYLQSTRYYRKLDRPYFTDKNPVNWRNIGLIHTILPNAKIIDARRNPMDCCFGNYTQHFTLGADYAFSQSAVADEYREYLLFVRHFDDVVPGLIHRVIHDDLVENFEEEVRRLLDYLELPFEEACLRFFETDRAVHTPSAQQVRQPINKAGFGRWRNYEPWLDELKQALGETIDDWRR